MSRTDVHKPDFAKRLDPIWRRHYRESHDHRFGPCDLDRFDPRARWCATSCHIDLVASDRNIHCGCRMCTAHDEFRSDRRRDRHQAKRAARAELKERYGSG